MCAAAQVICWLSDSNSDIRSNDRTDQGQQQYSCHVSRYPTLLRYNDQSTSKDIPLAGLAGNLNNSQVEVCGALLLAISPLIQAQVPEKTDELNKVAHDNAMFVLSSRFTSGQPF